MKKFNLLFLSIQLAIIAFYWHRLPPQLPLFYSRPWGEEQLANPAALLFLPTTSLTLFLINLFFASSAPKEEKLLQKILTSASTIFSLLCLITLIQIIKLVI